MMTSKEAAQLAARALDAKKAQNIRVLRTTDVTVLADYFVLCTATSTTQLKMLADEVSYVMERGGETTLHTEGARECGWMLVDFGSVVVHLFLKEKREFYALERLWGDAPEEDVAAILKAAETGAEEEGTK